MFWIKKKKPTRSLTERIVWGKTFGFFIGMIAFLSLPALSPEMNLVTGFAIWLWYVLFGAIIGFMGLFEKHPVLKFRMPPIFRGALVGAGLNLILGLFIYQDISLAFSFVNHPQFLAAGPILLVMVEGAAWGMILDFVLSRWLGEGKNLVKKL